MIFLHHKKRSAVGAKILSTILLVSVLVPPFFVLTTEHADAQFVPVSEIPLAPTHISHLAETYLNVTGKELGFDGILWMAAKLLIQQITSDLVSWINSGFNGSPAFVQNIQGFFFNVADKALGAFLEGTSLAFLCDPFKLNIQIALQKNFFSTEEKTTCRLTDVIANIDNFMSGDFLEGGFSGLMYMTMVPVNNMYGAYLLEDQALSLSLAAAGHREEMKLNWGSGFLSFETCAPPEPGLDPVCETKTPGKVIESQLENVLGSGIRQLELADEFDEVIGALMSQLVNQVMQQGLSALGNATGGGTNGPSFIGRLRTDIINQSPTTPTPGDVGFVPPPPGTLPGSLPPTTFTYTISSPGIVSIAPGGLASIPITKTLQSGTPVSVSLTVPSAPSIVTSSSFGGEPCTPTCTSNVIFTVSPTAALGTYPAEISGSPAPTNGPIRVTINVTNTPPPPDTTPPIVTFGTAVGVGNGVSLIVPVTFTDNVAINSFRITFTNTGQTFTATASPQNFTFNVSTFSQGTPLNFTATAFDTSGNQTTATKTTDLFGDLVP